LTSADIRTTVVNFVRQHQPRGVRLDEVVQAVRAAYPDLKPDDILMDHQKAEQATQRMVERMVKTVKEQSDDDTSS
jgi:uncharacterized iron-regulated membrane protein